MLQENGLAKGDVIRQRPQEVDQEKTRLRETLFTERRLHEEEKHRFEEMLSAVDEELSLLPTRLGKILMRSKLKCTDLSPSDCGDFEVTISDHPKNLENVPGLVSTERCSQPTEPSSPLQLVPKKPDLMLQRTKDLSKLVECLRQSRSSTPIEVLVDNQLLAISLLKTEINNTRNEIEEATSESEVSCMAASAADISAKESTPRAEKANQETTYEVHIRLQQEAVTLLTKKLGKTEELLLEEISENEKLTNEKKYLEEEVSRLKITEEKYKAICAISEKMKTELEECKTTARPYRTIKELKRTLEERNKDVLAWKSKLSRSEAASANKTTLLENERKKNGELEGKMNLMKNQMKNWSCQMSSLKEFNSQLKQQVEMMKKQLETIPPDKPDICCHPISDKPALGDRFLELAEILKNHDHRVKRVQEDATEKLKEAEKAYQSEMQLVRFALAKSEKMNLEYLKSVKELLQAVHEHSSESQVKVQKSETYDRACDILNISRQELDMFFSACEKGNRQNELQKWYDDFLSMVTAQDLEFSSQLSDWLFQIIKSKISGPARNDNKS